MQEEDGPFVQMGEQGSWGKGNLEGDRGLKTGAFSWRAGCNPSASPRF